MNGALDLYGEMFAELNRLQQSFEQSFRPGGAGNIRKMADLTFRQARGTGWDFFSFMGGTLVWHTPN
jgi:hypothetical protein